MKILITGGSGFVGTQVVNRLLAKGHDVLNVSHQVPHEAAHRPFWREVDILDAGPLRETLTAFAPDQVMHLAAWTEMDEKPTADTGFCANTQGTRNLLAAV